MPNWVFVLIVVLFAVFLLIKSRVPLVWGNPKEREARKRLLALRAEISASKRDRPRRAELWREAAVISLEELERPYRAAIYARRADKLAPHDAKNLSVVVRAFSQARRFRSLEKLLWRRLDSLDENDEATERAFEHLVSLYEGPLRRPAQARVLRGMRDRS
jgi:hypothetical protein